MENIFLNNMKLIFFFPPSRYDPDILLGYEVQMHSWGYLLQRAAALNVDLCQMISRVPGKLLYRVLAELHQKKKKLKSINKECREIFQKGLFYVVAVVA